MPNPRTSAGIKRRGRARVVRALGLAALAWTVLGAETNLWPNPGLEADLNRDGLPDFWNRGGSQPGFDRWDSSTWVSSTHSLLVGDTSATGYGEWYSDFVALSQITTYQLRFQRRYATTGVMRLSALFHDAHHNLLQAAHFTVFGTNDAWQEFVSDLIVPGDARNLRLSIASGGGLDVQGRLWIDDLALRPGPVITNAPGRLRQVEAMPAAPDSSFPRAWKQVARDYDALAFDLNASGPFLPLARLDEDRVNFNLTGMWQASYVGTTTHGGEAITSLAGVLGATLVGIDKTREGGRDWVTMQSQFFNRANGEDLVLNRTATVSGQTFWYELYPHILFYALVDKYPEAARVPLPFRGAAGSASLEDIMRVTAGRWRDAAWVLGGRTNRADFNWTAFHFATMQPVFNGRWREPDAAAAVAWLEYMAWVKFGEPRFLEAARWALDYLERIDFNPYYEILLPYGAYLAARHNAEHGTTYPVQRLLEWCFDGNATWRYGWGVASERWGGHSVHGLAASLPDGYAFAMNTFSMAGALVPLARYDPRYARTLGKWMLHVAANARLFYPDSWPAGQQSSAFWTGDPRHAIPYEGLRREWAGFSPYATGDPLFNGWGPKTDLALYSGSHVGLLAGIVDRTSDPLVLKLDLLATDYFHAPAFPTFLYYNPYDTERELPAEVGPEPCRLYDSVEGRFVSEAVTGTARVAIPPNSARVLVLCPATGAPGRDGNRVLVDGVVIDYANGERDTDGDHLPDWWESRYFGDATGAEASSPSANRFTQLECFQLGIDPRDATATFAVAGIRLVNDGRCELRWSSVGGRTYAVESSVEPRPGGFRLAGMLREQSVANGMPSTLTFVDEGEAETGRSLPTGRFYRLRLAPPE